jgi:LDH2 family malate/lactate/ureidoglycolate dehydrogenase
VNTPPTDGFRVFAGDLRRLVYSLFLRVPLPDPDARLIADLLVDTELRGVVSHGVVQVERYLRSYREGGLNPRPEIRLLKEGPATAAFSGDGGLGLIVAERAMRAAIAKAGETGVGVATGTYHGHVGSLGKYARMALREGRIAIVCSGRSADPEPRSGGRLQDTIQGSPPLAFGMPAGPDRPDMLLDMASHLPWDPACFERMPQVYFRALGLSHAANILSGTLGGQMLREFDRRNLRYRDADQSGFFMAIDVERFVPLGDFLDDMDRLMDSVARATPFPGFPDPALPGGLEWKREKEYRREGIPLSRAAIGSLERLAAEAGLPVPW